MNRPMHRIEHIHFVGIGGAGMGGIAEVLLNLGYTVSGSDIKQNAMAARLENMGASVFIGHAPENIESADVVVISTAIPDNNPEVATAHERRIPVVRRAEMLAELMRFKFGIAIAGTHGKTTTTSLTASVLAEAGEDPTFVIGGLLNSTQSNAKLGAGRYLVAEADESDASFLHLQPILAVVTNVDVDHLGTYEGDVQRLHHSFIEFLSNLPFYGTAIMCVDDAGVREIMPDVHRRILTYGMHETADVRAIDLKQNNFQTNFSVVREGYPQLDIQLNMPGLHNVQNALASIAIAQELGLEEESILKALYAFDGIGRRFEQLGRASVKQGEVTLVDDYAHHPVELQATLQAAKQVWPDRRLVAIFQPHRYTRTHELMDDFVQVLSGVDKLLLTEVYPAGEKEI
ncbi:MAG: UDP-N-acetylmuramate--L-alanine ligase, partial [Gammaproteobacteria bacterium]|nr:UDP-N-acetylmuramate--L-alanine ligase [Gammaproteobacteria bacterium]